MIGWALALASGVPQASEPSLYREGRAAFVREMEQTHGWASAETLAVLKQARYSQKIIDAMERPYEAQPWHRYRKLFLTQARIDGGVRYWREQRPLLERVSAAFGVAPEILVAILGVETAYGANTGSHRAIDALTTLGFAYPKRAAFFRGELEALLRLGREEGIDTLGALGSYAGALGKPQFIPTSYRAYAVDFDDDDRRDLWGSDADVLASVANYFRRHGWRSGEPVAFPATVAAARASEIAVAEKKPMAPNTTTGALRLAGVDWREPVASDQPATLLRLDGEAGDEYWVTLPNFYAITRYNHSNLYAMAILQLSQAIREAVEVTSAAPAGG